VNAVFGTFSRVFALGRASLGKGTGAIVPGVGDGSCGRHSALTQQPRGHHDVGINGPERYLQVLGGADSPVLRFTQGIFVANDDGRADLFTKFCKAVIRISPEHKADIAFGEFLFDVRNSAGEKAVVPQISVRIKRRRSQKRNHRLAKFVAKLDRHIQSWVIQCSLGALHPVDYALSFWIRRSGFPRGDAGIETECLDVHRSEAGENADTFSPSFIFRYRARAGADSYPQRC
jgi:hypothetical protein